MTVHTNNPGSHQSLFLKLLRINEGGFLRRSVLTSKRAIPFLLLLLMPPVFGAQSTRLSSSLISVTLHHDEARLSVDLPGGNRKWVQAKSIDRFQVTDTETRRGPGHAELLATLSGPVALKMSIILPDHSREIHVTLFCSQPQPFSKPIAFPGPFQQQEGQGEIVLPYQEGLLIETDDSQAIEAGGDLFSLAGWPPGGLTMPWFGLVDSAEGVLTIIETPFDANVRLRWQDNQLSAQVEWEPSFDEWSYPRKIIYTFHEEGAHVALAKRYRSYVQDQGRFRTLRQKADVNPALNRFLGSPQIWPWGDLAAEAFIDELKQAGFRKAVLMLPHHSDDQAAARLLEKAHAAGYLLGRYDNYNLANEQQWSYRADLDAAKVADGSPLTRSGNKVLTCGVQAFERALFQQAADLQKVRYDVQFMDTLLSQRLRECRDPAHPLSRGGDSDYRTRIMALATQKYRQVTGSEDGIDYAFQFTDFLEGPMTLHRFVDKEMKRTVWEGTDDSGKGILKPLESDESGKDFKLVPTASGELYRQYGLNESRRVPLLELVYHDSVSTTYHWRWSNHRVRDFWWKADLLNILYGTRPMWFIDRDLWDHHRQAFIESYQKICSWHERIAFDEMVAHRYLSKDRSVQQTDWSSGISVIVNFSASPVKVGDSTIPGRDFRILENAAALK